MTPDQIAQTYDHLAAFWTSDGLDASNGLEAHRRALRFLKAPVPSLASASAPAGAEAQRAALDVGCGSSGRLAALLLAEGLSVTGVDISEEMLRLARVRQPGAIFLQADVVTWELPQAYDFISAWDSIWHVPLAGHEALLRKLCAGLKPGGVLILTAGGTEAPGELSGMMMGQPVYHATLGLPRLLEVISGAGCVCRHLEYDQHPELHVYLIVQRAGAS